MTTAARPTFDHAKGKSRGKSSTIKHARELTQHTTIKYRKRHSSKHTDFESDDEDDRDNDNKDKGEYDEFGNRVKRSKFAIEQKSVGELKLELMREERKERGLDDYSDKERRRLITYTDNDVKEENESEEEGEASLSSDNSSPKIKQEGEEDFGSSDAEEGSSSEDDEDSEDEALLLEELNKIKRERAEAKAKLEEAELEAKAKISNPLLNYQDSEIESKGEGKPATASATSVKKSWRDQSVFKRDKSGSSSGEKKDKSSTFVNDMLKNDYHKKFMNKYVR